ncbi:MAG: LPS export ABC transporter permease LptG [Gammaproteobacteria bacterium]|nr:LPS export ABC transporter permease LptG [Gammaproteobacteria bacterium]
MKVLYRYIARTVFQSTLLVLFVLLSLYSFMDFINELDEYGRGSYGLGEIFSYLALTMPQRIYDLLPVASLLGSVLGLGTLASQSELVAIRAAGLSIQQINKAVAVVALGLMIFTLFIGEVVRPITAEKADANRSLAQTGTVGMQSLHGFWTRNGLHFNHIDLIYPDGKFKGVSVYEFDTENRLRIITRAKEAIYQDDGWLLTDVVQSTIDEQGVQVRVVERARWHSPLNPGIANIVVIEPQFLSVWNLYQYISYLTKNKQSAEKYQMAFWTKMMMPITTAVMVFLAVPFVFGPLRATSIGGRILAGALVGIGFHLFNQTFQHIGLVFGVLPWLAAMVPTVFFAILGWYLMRRIF